MNIGIELCPTCISDDVVLSWVYYFIGTSKRLGRAIVSYFYNFFRD